MRELICPSTTGLSAYGRQSQSLCGQGGENATLQAVNSELTKLFVDRLKEELGRKGLTVNAFAELCKPKGAGYGSVFRILKGKQDPTLSMVFALSEALGLPAWYLLTRKDQVEERVIRTPTNVVRLPDPYPKIFGDKPVRKLTNGKRSRK